MVGYRVAAALSLTSAGSDSGFRLPSGTPSILAVFATEEGRLQFGATIATQTGEPLVPGSQHPDAVIEFLADEAAIYAAPGTRFELWYGGTVGSGTVLEILDEVDGVSGNGDG